MNNQMKQLYMNIAAECASMSKAVRLQVGCVVVKDNNIISFSWNGTPAGWDNTCEDRVYMDSTAGGWLSPPEIYEQWPHVDHELKRYALKTKPEVLHAEMNSLMKLAKSSNSGEGATLFVTHSPCLDCAKGIYQAGIKEVFYREDYRTNDGIVFLKKCGIRVEKVDVHGTEPAAG